MESAGRAEHFGYFYRDFTGNFFNFKCFSLIFITKYPTIWLQIPPCRTFWSFEGGNCKGGGSVAKSWDITVFEFHKGSYNNF